jgi:hypothetical protein
MAANPPENMPRITSYLYYEGVVRRSFQNSFTVSKRCLRHPPGAKEERLMITLRALVVSLLILPSVGAAESRQVDPPPTYYREIKRSTVGNTPFLLVAGGHPTFGLFVSDTHDPILNTAAEDFARYFGERWGTAPVTVRTIASSQRNLIVLAALNSKSLLPTPLQEAVTGAEDLEEQAYVIRRTKLAGGHVALVCLGGASIGARYATIDLLRRMTVGKETAAVSLDSLRDGPYFTWRAIYINDSAHQMNSYNPNLIYDVNTYRWSPAQWERYIDQLAFFRYNVLQLWITPNMFVPDALEGQGAFGYFRATMRHVGQYARQRGITLALITGINVATQIGTRLDTIPLFKDLPVYTYLSPNKSEEKAWCLRLWDYWSKALPEVGIWSLFPADPGGCMEEGCNPGTYVDLALEVGRLIKQNNPKARIDFTTWSFFGWGPDFTFHDFNKGRRVDRGFDYLLSRLDQFPADSTFGINLNEFTSEPGIRGSGHGQGSTAKYITEISKKHLVHTWNYFATEGEGWINHSYKVPQILAERDIEARFPIAGGICYTMTPSFNLLNQFASAEAYWNPKLSVSSIMEAYTEGVFGTSRPQLGSIFPLFQIAPMVGYTFAETPSWKPNYDEVFKNMDRAGSVLESLHVPKYPRFEIMPTLAGYVNELVYFCILYKRLCTLGSDVAQCRELVHAQPAFQSRKLQDLHIDDARTALNEMQGGQRRKLQQLLYEIQKLDVAKMKMEYRAKHYQVFLDHRTEFTQLLPRLVNGFFAAFGADFVTTSESAPPRQVNQKHPAE